MSFNTRRYGALHRRRRAIHIAIITVSQVTVNLDVKSQCPHHHQQQQLPPVIDLGGYSLARGWSNRSSPSETTVVVECGVNCIWWITKTCIFHLAKTRRASSNAGLLTDCIVLGGSRYCFATLGVVVVAVWPSPKVQSKKFSPALWTFPLVECFRSSRAESAFPNSIFLLQQPLIRECREC